MLFNNTNSPDWVGKTAPGLQPGNWAFSNHMTRLRPADDIDARFLAAQLQYLQDIGYFRHLCVNHVNQAIETSIHGASMAVFDPTDPHLLTPEQRLDEAASLLATGVRRGVRPALESASAAGREIFSVRVPGTPLVFP